jgi:hypothetical protein
LKDGLGIVAWKNIGNLGSIDDDDTLILKRREKLTQLRFGELLLEE